MSELRVNFDSPVVAYGTAAVGGAAVGSLVPSASKFIKSGIQGMKADSFIRKAAYSVNDFKNGAVARIKSAFHELFHLNPLPEGQSKSALREFAESSRNLIKQTYNWFNNKPMAKFAVVGAAVAMAGLFVYNKITKND